MDYAYHSKLVLACSLASSLSTFFREATSKIKCEFSNGSLCRPSDSYFTYCSWLATLNCLGEQRLASRMHSTFLYMVTHGCEVDPMQMMRFEALDDTHAVRKMMCLSLKCTRVTQLLLLLLKHYMLASPVSHLSAASGFLQDISVGLFSGNQAALVFDELQWQHNFPSFSQQGLSQDFAFTDHMIVAGYAWFLESSPSHKVFKSKMQVPYILRGSRYYEVLDELFSGGPISLRVESWGRPKLSDSSSWFNFSYLFAASGRMTWSSLW
ncbi:hypothetical protein Bca4012_076697 [Brassica carinata]